MPPKRTSTSEASAITQAAIKKLVADSVTAALEAQTATMVGTSNPNKNTGPTGTPRYDLRNDGWAKDPLSVLYYMKRIIKQPQSAIIDCKNSKIALREGYARSVFGVREHYYVDDEDERSNEYILLRLKGHQIWPTH
ncbi:hypothetical protein Tco_0868773 [Tanacetum coccineum]